MQPSVHSLLPDVPPETKKRYFIKSGLAIRENVSTNSAIFVVYMSEFEGLLILANVSSFLTSSDSILGWFIPQWGRGKKCE